MTIIQKSSFATAFVSDSLLNFDPIIVIGSPRSGTSVVARLLQEKCGVMMDEGPIRKDWRNPEGYYEDHKLCDINKGVLDRWQHGTHNEDRMNKEWVLNFAQWVTMRATKYDKWGFKEPRMIGFIHWTLQFFNHPIFIWTIRSDEQIVKSQVEKLGYTSVIAKAGVQAYKNLIDKNLSNKNLFKIDLTEYVSENILTGQLREIINGCCYNRK